MGQISGQLCVFWIGFLASLALPSFLSVRDEELPRETQKLRAGGWLSGWLEKRPRLVNLISDPSLSLSLYLSCSFSISFSLFPGISGKAQWIPPQAGPEDAELWQGHVQTHEVTVF